MTERAPLDLAEAGRSKEAMIRAAGEPRRAQLVTSRPLC
jgi:hypothetical protein